MGCHFSTNHVCFRQEEVVQPTESKTTSVDTINEHLKHLAACLKKKRHKVKMEAEKKQRRRRKNKRKKVRKEWKEHRNKEWKKKKKERVKEKGRKENEPFHDNATINRLSTKHRPCQIIRFRRSSCHPNFCLLSNQGIVDFFEASHTDNSKLFKKQ